MRFYHKHPHYSYFNSLPHTEVDDVIEELQKNLILFQLTTSHRGRREFDTLLRETSHFNSLPHTEVDINSNRSTHLEVNFNSLPHTEVDHLQSVLN